MRLYPLYLLTDREKFGIVAAPSTSASVVERKFVYNYGSSGLCVGAIQFPPLCKGRHGGVDALNPHDFRKSPKSLPVPEMEKLMLTHIQVRDDDLRALASQRAMNVKETILKSGKIEPARVFVVEPKSLSPERRETVRDSRVDFRLR